MKLTLTIDEVNEVATAQFTDDAGQPVAGPGDPHTGLPIVPKVVSTDTGIVHASECVPGDQPGQWTSRVTPMQPGHPESTIEFLLNPVEDSRGNLLEGLERVREPRVFHMQANSLVALPT